MSLHSLLAETISASVVPRLVDDRSCKHNTDAENIFGTNRSESPRSPFEVVNPDNNRDVVQQLAELVLSKELTDPVPAALAFIDSLYDVQREMHRILVDLVAPTARYIGFLWTTDTVDFTEVTISIGRLQQLTNFVCESSRENVSTCLPAQCGKVLLTPAFMDQHSFGISMLGNRLRSYGWTVRVEPSITPEAIESVLSSGWYDAVGISIATDRFVPLLPEQIATVRAASLNPDIGVLVGGRIGIESPELLENIDADACCISDSVGNQLFDQFRPTSSAPEQLEGSDTDAQTAATNVGGSLHQFPAGNNVGGEP